MMESEANPPRSLALDIRPPVLSRSHSALSPETPSSTFGRTPVLQDSSAKRPVVLAILLSHWDNILGPRISHLWHVHSDTITLDMLNYVANHTLSGEICRDSGNSSVDSKFCVLKERDLVVTAFVFTAQSKGDLSVHSLCVIVAHRDLRLYLNWQTLTMSWMQRGIAQLRILLDKFSEEQAFLKFTPFLTEFLSMFNSILESPVLPDITLLDTTFHPEHQLEPDFMRRVVLSHLATCGRSVVIGETPAKINRMIATLAMFLRSQEKSCCRYVMADRSWSYHPDLCIQGFLVSDGEPLWRTLRDIYLSQYPTTLVDLSRGTVQRSTLPHKHRVLRHQATVHQLRALWQDQTPLYPTKDMFRSADDPDTLVTDFFSLMSQTPAHGGHREALVAKFVHLLEKKAFTLLKYVEVHSHQGKLSLHDNIKKMKQDLSLTVTGDFNVVMATAERLRPDLYSAVYGESALVQPQQQANVKQH